MFLVAQRAEYSDVLFFATLVLRPACMFHHVSRNICQAELMGLQQTKSNTLPSALEISNSDYVMDRAAHSL